MPTERDFDAPQEGMGDEPQADSEVHGERGGEPHRLLWGLGAVGVFAVVAGVLSFLLEYWYDLPHALKFLLVGSLAVGSAWGAGRAAQSRDFLPRDMLLLFHSGMVFLMIWVVAAVYHLHGHPWRFFALSALLSLPGALVGKMVLLADVTLGFSVIAALLWLAEREWLGPLFGPNLGIAFLCASLGLLSLAWHLRARDTLGAGHAIPRSLHRWGWILLAIPLFTASFAFSWPVYTPVPLKHWLPMVIFAFVAFRVLPKILPNPRQSWERMSLILGGLLLFGAVLTAGRMGEGLRQLLGLFLTCGFGVALAMTLAARKSRLGVALTIIALVLRVTVFFLEGMEWGSLGLLLAGAFFCLVSYGAWKMRDLLFAPGSVREGAPPAPARPLFDASTQRRLLAALALAAALVFGLWIAREELRQRDTKETELRPICEESPATLDGR